MRTRRTFLTTTSALLGAASLAGCTGSTTSDPDPTDGDPIDDADIVAGPNGALAFEPASLTVAAGETVTWGFPTPSHNVSCTPAHTDEASLPAGAEPFASYEGDDKYGTMAAGTTFSHAVVTPGTYVYVCVPHIAHGMVGELTVTD